MGLGINDDGSSHEEAAILFTLQFDGEGDMCAISLPAERDEMKWRRPPCLILESLHQGTLSCASEDQECQHKSRRMALIPGLPGEGTPLLPVTGFCVSHRLIVQRFPATVAYGISFLSSEFSPG